MASTTLFSGARASGTFAAVDHRAVLVPLDGSGISERALEPGPLLDPTAYVSGLGHLPELAGTDVESHVVFDPLGPDQGLVDHLAAHPTTLVAAASRLRTHLDRALHGSATAQIVHGCPVPVLVQPALPSAAAHVEGSM